MRFEAACPGCGARDAYDTAYVGTKRSCVACGRSFTLEGPKPERPKAKALKQVPGVNLKATCPSCAHEFLVSVAFAGTKRPCPACKMVFLVARTVEVQEEIDARRNKDIDSRRPHYLGCDACVRVATVQLPEGASFACPYCGKRDSLEAAQQLGVLLLRIDSHVEATLMGGAAHRAIIEAVPVEARAFATRLLERALPQLGTTRDAWLERRDRGEAVVLRAPPVCDKCYGPGPVSPRRLVWERVEEESTDVHGASALTIFAGVVVTQKKRIIRTIREVSYLCARCEKSTPPPAPGFSIVRRAPLDL